MSPLNFELRIADVLPFNSLDQDVMYALKKSDSFREHVELFLSTGDDNSDLPVTTAGVVACPSPIHFEQANEDSVSDLEFDGQSATGGEHAVSLHRGVSELSHGEYMVTMGGYYTGNSTRSSVVVNGFVSGPQGDYAIGKGMRVEPKDASGSGDAGSSQSVPFELPPKKLVIADDVGIAVQMRFGSSVAGVDTGIADAWIKLEKVREVYVG